MFSLMSVLDEITFIVGIQYGEKIIYSLAVEDGCSVVTKDCFLSLILLEYCLYGLYYVKKILCWIHNTVL